MPITGGNEVRTGAVGSYDTNTESPATNDAKSPRLAPLGERTDIVDS
jgi:hypothetical protein